MQCQCQLLWIIWRWQWWDASLFPGPWEVGSSLRENQQDVAEPPCACARGVRALLHTSVSFCHRVRRGRSQWPGAHDGPVATAIVRRVTLMNGKDCFGRGENGDPGSCAGPRTARKYSRCQSIATTPVAQVRRKSSAHMCVLSGEGILSRRYGKSSMCNGTVSGRLASIAIGGSAGKIRQRVLVARAPAAYDRAAGWPGAEDFGQESGPHKRGIRGS